MKNKLRILVLEDSKADYELIRRELDKGKISFESTRVEDKDSFIKGLSDLRPDIILADYKLPSFDAMSALEIVMKDSPRTPFIIVTGTISEEVAVESIKAGAADYILKDRLARLASAMMNAIERKQSEEERETALRELRKSEQRYRTIFNISPEVIVLVDKDATILDINSRVKDYVGYAPGEFMGKHMLAHEVIAERSRGVIQTNFLRMLKGEKVLPYEIYLTTKDGQGRTATLYTEAVKDENGEITAALAVILDVTEQKKAEEGMRKERDKARMYFESAGVMLLGLNKDQTVALINKKGCEILGYTCDKIVGQNWFDIFLPAAHRKEVEDVWRLLMAGDLGRFERTKGAVVTKNGEERRILWNNVILRDEDGRVSGTLSSGEDITEREKAEQELNKTLTALKEFKDLTVGRENRMIDLKKEINKLSEELGRPKPYDVSFSGE